MTDLPFHALPDDAFGPLIDHTTGERPVSPETVCRLYFLNRRPSTVPAVWRHGAPDWSTPPGKKTPIVAYRVLQWSRVDVVRYLAARGVFNEA